MFVQASESYNRKDPTLLQNLSIFRNLRIRNSLFGAFVSYKKGFVELARRAVFDNTLFYRSLSAQ